MEPDICTLFWFQVLSKQGLSCLIPVHLNSLRQGNEPDLQSKIFCGIPTWTFKCEIMKQLNMMNQTARVLLVHVKVLAWLNGWLQVWANSSELNPFSQQVRERKENVSVQPVAFGDHKIHRCKLLYLLVFKSAPKVAVLNFHHNIFSILSRWHLD